MKLDLESYPFDTTNLRNFGKEFLDMHAEHQKQAVEWALTILRMASELDGAWVDDRNRNAVLRARAMHTYYKEEVLGKVGV